MPSVYFLCTLWLFACELKHDAWRRIGTMKQLATLEVTFSKTFCDGDLQSLTGLASLTRLCVSGASITDEGLKSLKGMTALTQLDLGYTAVTDEGLSR